MAEDNSKIELTTIPACQVLKKIWKGEPVEYDHARIVGDLNLSMLDLHTQHIDRTDFEKNVSNFPEEAKLVKSEIKITNSRFEGDLRFYNAIFLERVTLNKSTLKWTANFQGSTFKKNADFGGSVFTDTDFSGSVFIGNAYFGGSFGVVANFKRSTFRVEADFTGSIFGVANFSGSVFIGNAYFTTSRFKTVTFRESTFKEYANFRGSTFNGNADFDRSTVNLNADFSGSTFNGNANFRGSTFNGNADFDRSTFRGDVLTFREAKFTKPRSQEEAYRRAKNILAKAGNRDEEEYHFYREMEAKRIQKGLRGNSGRGLVYIFFETEIWSFRNFLLHDVLEWLFVQKIFGYGVYPVQLFIWWLIIVAMFASSYAYGHIINGATNLLDYFKVSFAISIAPGYIATIINPEGTGYSFNAPFYQAVAIAETVVGTFLWASFIATFAKKYMR